jgi:uncharacterized alkaline shock family protein YloU
MGDGSGPAVPTVHVTHDVIGEIAAQAALGVAGVASLGGTVAAGLSDMLGRNSPLRGIRVDVNARTVDAAVDLIVRYGTRIPDVAQRVQEQVKMQVEHATGLRVNSVDIHIQGIAAPDSPQDQ